MKMNKKMLSLLVAGLLSVPFAVGCSDNEVVEQLPQTQIEEQPQEQQKPIDEDLNDEYKAKINEREQLSDLQLAKQYIDQIMAQNFPSIQYMIAEESGALVIIINLPANDIALQNINEWNKLVGTVVEYDIFIHQALQQAGVDVPMAVMVANLENDLPLIGVIDGEVVLDAVNNIDEIN